VVNEVALVHSASVARSRPSWHEHRAPLTRTAAVLLVLIAWEALARSGTVSPLFLSSPSQVVARLAQLFSSGVIWPHVRASGQEALIGFGLAIAVGVPIGIGMGRVAPVRHALEPLVAALYSAPAIAFLPLLIIWLGTGLWSKVFLIFVGAVVVLIVNTETGVSNVDAQLVEMARAFTASRRRVLTKVVLPAAAPFILAGLRLAVGRVLIMVVVAELYASTAGVGYLIFQAGAMYDATLVFAGVTIMAAVGIGTSQALRVLERRLAPWRQGPES
jgi:ABC-type nitrate/sulfonate/bicarbonate transport system permease component